MSPSAEERAAALLVAGAFVAVLAPVAVPLWLAIGAMIAAGISLRPSLMLAAVIVVIGARADLALAALHPAETRPIAEQWIRLADDPRPAVDRTTAVASLDGQRVFVVARAAAAHELSARSSGESLLVSGSVTGREPATSWARARRIVGQIDVGIVHGSDRAGPARSAATWFRRHLAAGAASLSAPDRALFTGLVYGDDRDQTVLDADDFRAAGLGHLLAVSGQNVLFVLVLAAPALSRIRPLGVRLAGTVAVLAFFGFVTRFEPSVLRALVMAGIAAGAAAGGRPTGAVRVLPGAILLLLLYDPLLGFSLAFQLSVAATGGLVVLSPRIEPLLRGPRVVRTALAATMGAQLAVSPILLGSIGSVSPVALPANLLAGPAAAFVMMWGLTAGTLAGIAPPDLAAVLHAPTGAALWWIRNVAGIAARVPTATFGLVHLLAVGGGLAIRLYSSGRSRLLGSAFVVAALIIPVCLPPSVGSGTHRLTDGLTLYRDGRSVDLVVVDGRADPADAVAALRHTAPGRIDLMIVTDGGRRAGRLVRTLRDRFDIVDVWAPPGHQVPGARVWPVRGRVGGLLVEFDNDGSVLVDTITRASERRRRRSDPRRPSGG